VYRQPRGGLSPSLVLGTNSKTQLAFRMSPLSTLKGSRAAVQPSAAAIEVAAGCPIPRIDALPKRGRVSEADKLGQPARLA